MTVTRANAPHQIPLLTELDLRDKFTSRARLSTSTFGEIYLPTDRAAVCLSFDDGPAVDYTSVFPLLKNRNLPATFNVNGPGGSSALAVGKAGRLSYAQLLDMQSFGMEIACHTRSHLDPGPTSLAEFVDEWITAANELVLLDGTGNLSIDSAQEPGTYATSSAYHLGGVSTVDSTAVGTYLRSRFSVVTGYQHESSTDDTAFLPTVERIGAGRQGGDLAATSTTLAVLKAIIARARGKRGIASFGTHSANIDVGGWNSLATVTTLLDFIAAERDAGRVEVYTVGAGYHLQHGTARQNLLSTSASQFLQDAASNYIGWRLTSGSVTLNAGDAPSGGNSITQSTPGATFIFDIPAGSCRSLLIKFKAKNDSAGVNSNARLIARGYDETASTQYNQVSNISGGATTPGPWLDVTDAWQTYTMLFRPDARSGVVRLWPFWSNNAGRTGAVRYADFEVYKT